MFVRRRRRVVAGVLGEFYRRAMRHRFSLAPNASTTFSIYVPPRGTESYESYWRYKK